MNIKTWLIATLFACGSAIALPQTTEAQETTGENLRVIMETMHRGLTDTDRKVKTIDAQQEQINARRMEHIRRLENEQNPERIRLFSAEILESNVQLNKLARERISFFASAIGDVLHPSLMKLGKEVENIGALGTRNWSEFEQYRSNMEGILPYVARELGEINRLIAFTTDPETAATLGCEVDELRSTLVFLHNSLASATEMGALVADDIYDHAHALGGVYAKLLVLDALLNQEANVLRGELIGQSWEAIKPFIDGEGFASALNSTDSASRSLKERTNDIKLIRKKRSDGFSGRTGSTTQSDDELVRRIAAGQMGW